MHTFFIYIVLFFIFSLHNVYIEMLVILLIMIIIWLDSQWNIVGIADNNGKKASIATGVEV